MKEVWIAAMLLWQSVSDIRKREVSGRGLLLFFAAGIAVFGKRLADGGIAQGISLLPGLLFAGVSLLSEGALGMGDALLLTALGLYRGIGELSEQLLAALFFAGICAGMLFLKNRNRRQTIPFVPFLLLGYLGGMWLWRQ